MIKRIITLLGLGSILVVASCSKDDPTPVKADFSLVVSGQSPNATVTITNSSSGASTYAWSFNEGSTLATSADKTPAPLVVDKAGTFEVTLIATNGGDVKTITKSIEVPGVSAIVSYKDIAFGRTPGSATYARYFSIQTGLSYKDSEVNATTGSKIDLAFSNIGTSVNYFASPDDSFEGFGIPGANTSIIINYPSSQGVTASIFDAANDDTFIKNVVIDKTDDNSFGSSNPNIVLFKTESGKKGAIKTTAINTDRLLVDIKVQKY